MANPYVIGLSKIFTNDVGGTQRVYQIDVYVTNSSTKIAGLVLADFNFQLNNKTTPTFTVTEGASVYSLKISSVVLPLSDFASIQVIDHTDSMKRSDELLIDFSQTHSGHQSTFSYLLPLQPGSYKMQLDSVNGDTTFSTSSPPSIAFDVRSNKPDALNSKILIDKPYLTKFAGDILNVTVTLNNTAQNADDGNYEVTFFADLQ